MKYEVRVFPVWPQANLAFVAVINVTSQYPLLPLSPKNTVTDFPVGKFIPPPFYSSLCGINLTLNPGLDPYYLNPTNNFIFPSRVNEEGRRKQENAISSTRDRVSKTFSFLIRI